jgi:protein-S-isoprenylcysteine O-methyltransferase Ste14
LFDLFVPESLRPMKWGKVIRYIDGPLFLGIAAFLFYQLQTNGLWSVRSVLGMVIAFAGFGLWLIARVQLGKSFAVRAEAKALVTTGLYSRIRNPVYVFGGIAYLGLLIAWGYWPAIVVFLVVYTAKQLSRIRKEEKVLEAAFGDEYRRYKAKTWF